MYAIVEDKKVVKVGALSQLFPNLSIPQSINEKDFAKENELLEVVTPEFDDFQEKIVPCEPFIKDGKVYAVEVQKMSDEEKSENVNAHISFELMSTAWVEQDPDMDKKSLAEWKEYRKKISSFKNSKDVSEITWPKRPLVELEKIMEEDPIA
jgi:tRNA nucleotidyltransferase/poly(A) polymerase